MAIAVAHSAGALASEPVGKTCQLNLARAPLDSALQEVGRQCALQLLFFSDITEGKTAPTLQGQYTLDEALHRLLDSAGLEFRHVNATTIEIRRATASPSRPVARTQSGTDSGLQEVVIHGAAEGLVATRIETPLREIPQSISVISGEQMRQQNNLNFLDAMQDAVGISFTRRDTYFRYLSSRGFSIGSYTLDGGGGMRAPPQSPAAPILLLTPDLGEFDRVEVLRGSNALFGADGAPGGAINLVRKRPLPDPAIRFSSIAGSWKNYRQELDATGPLALDGALRGRIVVSNASREFFHRGARDERQSLFGVLDYQLTGDTLVTLGGSYLKSKARPFEVGMLPFSDGTDPRLPRGAAHTFDWSRFDTRLAEGYLRLEQAFAGESRLRIQATFLDSSVTYAFGYLSAPLNPVTRRAPGGAAQYTLEPFGQTQLNLEATLTGAGHWWNRRVEWVLGGDSLRAASSSHSAQTGFGPPIDPWRFDPAAYPYPIGNITPLPLSTRHDIDTRIGGLFGSLRVQITEPWSVTAGLRVSSESVTDNIVYYWSGRGNPIYRDYEYENVATPYMGTLFKLNGTWSLYASYADIFAKNDGTLRSDLSDVSPRHGVTMEGGIKGAWRDGALNGSLALYKIVQRGIPVEDVATTQLVRLPTCCYTSDGRYESEGVDLELSGHLTSRWIMGGGYTFNQGRQIVPGRAQSVPLSSTVPRHLLRLWSDYELPGRWNRWTVGGTLHAQSRLAPSGTRVVQNSYAVINPRFGYQFDGRWRAALAINNLLDKEYYESIGGLWYGEPRNYVVRLDASF